MYHKAHSLSRQANILGIPLVKQLCNHRYKNKVEEVCRHFSVTASSLMRMMQLAKRRAKGTEMVKNKCKWELGDRQMQAVVGARSGKKTMSTRTVLKASREQELS